MIDTTANDELIGPDEAIANLERKARIIQERNSAHCYESSRRSANAYEERRGGAEIKNRGEAEHEQGNKEIGTARKKDWPILAPDAFHGLAGEVVRSIEPHTESDPVAILLQFLAYFGNAVGRGPYYQVEGDQHFTNMYTVLVGESSKARKGTSAGRVLQIFKGADSEWASRRVKSGLSSGEGLIGEVGDPIKKEGKEGPVQVVPGVDDKRLMVTEPEFAGALTVMQRHGNILSRVIRDAWDGRDLAVMVKNNPTHATGAHISIVGHITAEELRMCLDQVSMANGYANRFLFACIRRARLLPHGGDLDEVTVAKLALLTNNAITKARTIGRVTMTVEARAAWERVYGPLSQGAPGLLGAIVGRAEAQSTRLAMLYALLDGKSEIDVVHLGAALAVWGYCEASARYIFGEQLGDPVADEILKGLRQAGTTGMTRTEISKLFSGNRPSNQIGRALEMLHGCSKARFAMEPGGGKAAERWFFSGTGV